MTFRKLVFFVVFVAAAVTMFRHFNNPEPMKTEEKSRLEVWVCPVHSSLKFNRPGTCAMCGRDLVKQESSEEP